MEDNNQSGTACIMLSEARLRYWAKLPGWRLREAAALLLDLDPDDPNLKEQSSFRDLQRVLLRARSMKLIHSPIRPRRLLEWVAANQIKVPIRLQSEILGQTGIVDWRKRALHRGRRIAHLQNERPDPDINAKSKHTAERFFLCMALRWYRIEQTWRFNYKEMLNDVTINGKERISVEAIRDWMDGAKERQSEILDEVMRDPEGNPNRNSKMPPVQERPR